MANKFLAADLHLGHNGVCKFLAPDGVSKLRPWNTIEEMDEAIIEKWNSVVKPTDEAYILGDVVINRHALPSIARLNGRKHLIKGNHDIFRIDEYLEYFYEVSACRVLKDMILTHIPIHPSCIERFGTNVHGHLHAHKIPGNHKFFNYDEFKMVTPDDPQYICVSIEQTDFKPISLEDLKIKIAKQKFDFEDLKAPRCSCCGSKENLHRDLGSGGPYRCDSDDCVMF
jgi:calcineurin-like phosphoesterase family protein